MLLAGKEQIGEPSRSNFGAVKLLGSGGRIKPLCVCFLGAKGKNPQHLISTPQLLLWIAFIASSFN